VTAGRWLLGAVAACAVACSGAREVGEGDVLSRWNVVANDHGALTATGGAIAYEVRNGLFSDGAAKSRVLRVPAGTSARYAARGTFEFPVGTVAAKSIGFPAASGETRWVETRLLVRADDGWHGYVYAWSDDQRDAVRLEEGKAVTIERPGGPLRYVVPREDECASCHRDTLEPIGLGAVQLNRPVASAEGVGEQLTHWTARGIVAGAPPVAEIPRAAAWDDPTTGSVDDRARAYLAANCAHCHSPDGRARMTGLDLRLETAQPFAFGVCKTTPSPSTPYDIAPGDPGASFVFRRMTSTTQGEMMPPLGRSTVDGAAAALVATWIQQMTDRCP
jgi:uncharacterized repeat protein (TIGR03806 family)